MSQFVLYVKVNVLIKATVRYRNNCLVYDMKPLIESKPTPMKGIGM